MMLAYILTVEDGPLAERSAVTEARLGPRPLRQVLATVSLLTTCLALSPYVAAAEETIYEDDRTTLVFSADAVAVAFVQSNPWFGEDVANIGVEVDQWMEFAATPSLGFSLDRVAGGEVFGALSVVGTKTYGESADGLAVGHGDPSDATLEQLYLGWQRVFGPGRSFEIRGGNFDYEIASGLLVKDGGSDGGGRGGFYLGARSAFRRSGLVRIQYDDLVAEVFYLGNNPGRGGIEGEIAGVNLEYDLPDRAHFGFTYMGLVDVEDAEIGPIGEKLRTFDLRTDLSITSQFALSGEYAGQSGGPFEGQGWWTQANYEFKEAPWSPSIAYRYALVSGDSPNTPDFEGFQPLAYGFSEYETWYQGEIAGNWIFSNTNLRTHMLKASAALADTLTLTGAWLKIELDEPGAAGVTSDDFGSEFDLFFDWEVNDHLFASAALAVLLPDDGAKQFSGGDDTWSHFMLYLSYSY